MTSKVKINHGFCACCGSEITAPQFFDGKAYGYTCIKKVAPDFKRKKESFSLVDRSAVKVWPINGTIRTALVIKLEDGETYEGVGYSKTGSPYVEGDFIKIAVVRRNTRYIRTAVISENGVFLSEKDSRCPR